MRPSAERSPASDLQSMREQYRRTRELINAVERFDPERGNDFYVFARSTITGEIKRHFRDRAWSVRVPRSLHDRYLAVTGALERLNVELGRSPTMQEIGQRVGLTPEEVVEALEVATAYEPGSLDAGGPDGDRSTDGHMRARDRFAAVDDHVSLVPLLARLPPVERQILHLRFVDERSQSEIGEIIGVSQMQVSRVLRNVLARLRTQLESDG
jgi:RNA polymerase sigma-B factor